MSSTNPPPTTSSSLKMHSKHHRPHPHTMSSDYKPLYSTHRQLTTRNPTWPEQQASMILSLRDIYNPPRSIPDREVQNLDADKQIHARWTDPDLVWALVSEILLILWCYVVLSIFQIGRITVFFNRAWKDSGWWLTDWTLQSEMQDSLPGKGKLVLQYGGRDVTAATWVTVHQVCSSFPSSTFLLPYFPLSSHQPKHTQLRSIIIGTDTSVLIRHHQTRSQSWSMYCGSTSMMIWTWRWETYEWWSGGWRRKRMWRWSWRISRWRTRRRRL